jgi:GTP cyclohydrolase II
MDRRVDVGERLVNSDARIHSCCLTGEVLGSLSSNCGKQL